MKKRSFILVVICSVFIMLLFVILINIKHTKEVQKIPLPQLDSDINIEDDEIGFCYCVYEEVYRYAVEKKSSLKYLDVKDVITRYLAIAGLDDIVLDRVETEKINLKKYISKDIYYPDSVTYNVYLKGNNIDIMQINGLVNTILSYFDTVEGQEYVKVFFDNQLKTTSEPMPEPGYFIQRQTSFWEKARDKVLYEKNDGTSTDITFILKDRNGKTMKNIVYYIEGSNMEEKITNSTGKVELSVKTNNQYILRLQRKNAIVDGMYGDDASIYEEMIVCFDVKEGFESELIWDEENIISLCEATKEVIIDVTDFEDEPYENILVSINKNGASYEIGYCNKNGTIVWNDYGAIANKYIVTLEVDECIRHYEAEIKDGTLEIIKETLEEPKVYE